MDELLREQAYLVERGVRPLALVPPMPVQELLQAGGNRVIPFALEGKSGFASHAWVVDLVTWAESVPRVQRDRILGLLLGYSPDAVRHFEELGINVGPFN